MARPVRCAMVYTATGAGAAEDGRSASICMTPTSAAEQVMAAIGGVRGRHAERAVDSRRWWLEERMRGGDLGKYKHVDARGRHPGPRWARAEARLAPLIAGFSS